MRIKTKTWRGDIVTQSVAAYISAKVDSADSGVAERASDKADKAGELLGRLVDVLASKGVLSLEDVKTVAGESWREDIIGLEREEGV